MSRLGCKVLLAVLCLVTAVRQTSAGQWVFSRTSSSSAAYAEGRYTNDVAEPPDPNPVYVDDTDLSITASPILAFASSFIGTAPHYAAGAGSGACGYGTDNDDVATMIASSYTEAEIDTDGYGELSENWGSSIGACDMDIDEIASGGTFSLKATITIPYQAGSSGSENVSWNRSGTNTGIIRLWHGETLVAEVDVLADFEAGEAWGSGPGEEDSDVGSLILDGDPHEYEYSHTFENLTLNDVNRVTFYSASAHWIELFSGSSPASSTVTGGSGAECKIEIIPE